MRQKSKKIQPEEVLNALKKASAGDYSAILGLESEDDELGRIVLAVNAVLKKTETGVVQARAQAESMAQGAERYRHILDNIEESYFEVDLKGNLLFFNDTVLRDLGYTADEISGINFKNLTDEANAKKVYEVFHHVFQTGKPIKGFDWEIIKKNGETINVEASVALLRDEADRPVGFRGVVRDVSRRIRTQRDLRQSNERYQTLLDITTEGYLEEDLTGRITFANDAACRLMGYSREQLLGMSYRDYLIPSIADNLKEVFLEAYHSRNPVRLTDYDIVRPDGSTVTCEINAAVKYDHTGTPTGFRILLKDFTAKKKAEETLRESEKRFRMIVENVHEVICTTDMNLKITYMSPSCYPLSGYTPEELSTLSMEKFMTPETLAETVRVVTQEIERELNEENTGKYTSRTIEQEIIRKDGSTFWLEGTGSFIRDEQGKATGILLAGRDITERKKAEVERKRLEDQLTQAQKMEVIGRLAGGVAHDFNNMLSVILGYADLAKIRLAKQHPVLNDIAEIEKAALRSRDITTQLLAFSRKQIIEPRVIDLNGLIGHSQKAMIRLIGEDIRLEVIRPRGLWPVKVDPSQIEQILMNLAVNARDAMPGGGRLTIQTENRVLDKLYCESNPGFIPGEYVCLTVSDSGIGMDKETLKYIFEPFFTTKEAGKGTGLGLATIYGIVKQNEGFINVYSEPGEGASFSIYLPRVRDEKEAPDEEEYEHKPSGTGCILLAEDDATVLQIAKEMLESIGYTVIPAASPEEAVACCENPELHIDLVLTDVIMPGMNGSELVKKIRQTRPDMKTLYMSGYTNDVIARHGILERGVVFLQKPFTINTIADKVAQAMAAEPDS